MEVADVELVPQLSLRFLPKALDGQRSDLVRHGLAGDRNVAFDLGSREAVDELVERAGVAGGRIGDTDDYPFMYQRQFDDPDGYHYSPFWMKPDADPTA